jgi:SAM-dependent methyltransferase
MNPTALNPRAEFLAGIGETLTGRGVEFGAGASPFPVGASSVVSYADRNTNSELQERQYFGESPLVQPNVIADFETMAGIEPESVDFIIASHVIEHTSNPLGALRSAYQRLRRGGKLVLVVPDKTVTFDRDRPITTLEHLLADYLLPCRERDLEHYIEFYSKAFPQPDPLLSAKAVYERGDDIHFHVWTYESFDDLIGYACRNLDPWSSVWSRRRLSEQDIEFYFILTK